MSTQPFSLPDIKRILIETLKLEGVTPDEIGDDEPLFGGRFGFDSIDALEFVVALEKRFGMRIRADELSPAAFSTVGALFSSLKSCRDPVRDE